MNFSGLYFYGEILKLISADSTVLSIEFSGFYFYGEILNVTSAGSTFTGRYLM
jgi:predicted flavoprotein YhiN